ncbi:MAG: DUF1993 family protein [Sphingomonadales bacterium]|nr:DUF1993 family protein [Sphingomonadales bacterium]
MTLSHYDAAVPTFLQLLPAVGRVLARGGAFAAEHGLADEALTGARLANDMWDLSTQVRALCVQSADALAGAVAGSFTPRYPPAPRDFAGLGALVSDAIARIKAIPRADVEALAGREVVLRAAGTARRFTAAGFLTGFVLPNFQFHVVTTYAILRGNGVPLGKFDYLGRIPVLAD